MKKWLLLFAVVSFFNADAQFSISSDLSVMRQFGKQQSFWSLAQNVQLSYAFTRTESLYFSIGNATPHKEIGKYVTQAKVDTFYPKAIGYRATTSWTTRQFSAGLKHYFAGTHNSETGTNIYGIVGVGLMSVKLLTEYSIGIDTVHYQSIVPYAGTKAVNRLSADLGVGIEAPLRGSFYWYAQAKTWIHAGTIPSNLLTQPNDKIVPVMLGAGIRVLIGNYE